MSDITVVIVTCNRQAMLRELLENLSHQSVAPYTMICDDSEFEGYHRVSRYNEGVSRVTTPYVILLDDDCLPMYPRFAEAYVRLLRYADVVRGLFGTLEKPEIAPWFSAANLGMRTELAQSLGPFDMAYDSAYGYEDIDLGKTLEKIGAKVILGDSDTGVIHRGIPDHSYHTGLERNRLYFISKWGE